jgi:Xaa-Pro aminopeptidase
VTSIGLPRRFILIRSEQNSMFSKQTYQARRAHLAHRVGTGLVLLPGHQSSPINFGANAYPFRQDSTFLYYGGPSSPGLAVVVDCDANDAFLCGCEAQPDDALWSGPVPTLAAWAEAGGFDQVKSLDALGDLLAAAQRAGRPIHYLPDYRVDMTLTLARLLSIPARQVRAGVSHKLIATVVAQRAIKTDEEVAEIEVALGICRTIFQEIATIGLENQMPAVIMGRMAMVAYARNSRFAFAPIVTPHGEILHGGVAAKPLKTNELLVVDVGVESPRGYASDITRTLPVGGRFDRRQRDIYEIVLKAQKTAIAAMAPGVRFRDVHLGAAGVICQGLKEMGIMQGDVEEAVAEGAHALFFPHGLGHMLGLDAHDMEALGEDHVGYDDETRRSHQFGLAALRLGRRLESGFVVTVEPGIYFNRGLIERWREAQRAAAFIDYGKLAAFDGFGGIRIEDDVLITDKAARVLGPTIPKSVATIEASLT